MLSARDQIASREHQWNEREPANEGRGEKCCCVCVSVRAHAVGQSTLRGIQFEGSVLSVLIVWYRQTRGATKARRAEGEKPPGETAPPRARTPRLSPAGASVPCGCAGLRARDCARSSPARPGRGSPPNRAARRGALLSVVCRQQQHGRRRLSVRLTPLSTLGSALPRLSLISRSRPAASRPRRASGAEEQSVITYKQRPESA